MEVARINKDNIIEFKNGSTVSSPKSKDDAVARGKGAENIYIAPEIDEQELKQYILDSIVLPKGISKTEMLNIIETVLDKEHQFLLKKL